MMLQMRRMCSTVPLQLLEPRLKVILNGRLDVSKPLNQNNARPGSEAEIGPSPQLTDPSPSSELPSSPLPLNHTRLNRKSLLRRT